MASKIFALKFLFIRCHVDLCYHALCCLKLNHFLTAELVQIVFFWVVCDIV